ncbi:hypothetical protein CPB86DRAFT_688988, partial [Serendipita vermifera]
LKQRRPKDYHYFMEYQTRWNDNDQYSHLNNSVYNLLFDTIINKYLIEQCGLQPVTSSTDAGADEQHIALVIESHANFFRPLSFPERIVLGMRVAHLGQSSVRYEVGVFGPIKRPSTNDTSQGWSLEDETPSVVGGFTHVFVHRTTRRPAKQMPSNIRQGLEAI